MRRFWSLLLFWVLFVLTSSATPLLADDEKQSVDEAAETSAHGARPSFTPGFAHQVSGPIAASGTEPPLSDAEREFSDQHREFPLDGIVYGDAETASTTPAPVPMDRLPLDTGCPSTLTTAAFGPLDGSGPGGDARP